MTGLIWFLELFQIMSICINDRCYDVVQQPDMTWISEVSDQVTLFGPAAAEGMPWFLAHDNTPAGADIAGLEVGDTVTIYNGFLHGEYVVTEINTYSYPDDQNKFSEIMAGDGIILQTCAGDGFVIVKAE